MDNRYECGCERGGDCTKTTMCAIQSALEDQAEALETALTEVSKAFEAGYEWAALRKGTPEQGLAKFRASSKQESDDGK